MIYRFDKFVEGNINPVTGKKYDTSWIVLILTKSEDYEKFVGSSNGCAYTLKVSKRKDKNWQMSVGDFISFNKAEGKNVILVMSESDYNEVQSVYSEHSYSDALREYEPKVLVHSTSLANWDSIKHDGMLKSWNVLKGELDNFEDEPIGAQLGDPTEFSDYIMFGSGAACEIVVASKQVGQIIWDVNATYVPGARLYFNLEKIANDGLLIRDGAHMKVKNKLPLQPYLLFVATADKIDLSGKEITLSSFAQAADKLFIANNFENMDR